MLKENITKIVFIGAGRLANYLGVAFHKVGLEVVQVYNRTAEKGEKLAGKTGASFIDNIAEITPDADLYILAVSDSVLDDLASKLRLKDKLVVHTSGTVAMDILTPISSKIGVFYPVQTFSQRSRVDFRKIPVCIEGNSPAVQQALEVFARRYSKRVCALDSDQRRLLHLGAVFANNFTNYIYGAAEELLTAHDIPFDLLEPLILQTAKNVKDGSVAQCQTGPAMRGDMKVLEKHREMLADHPDFLDIYNVISNKILKQRSPHGKL